MCSLYASRNETDPGRFWRKICLITSRCLFILPMYTEIAHDLWALYLKILPTHPSSIPNLPPVASIYETHDEPTNHRKPPLDDPFSEGIIFMISIFYRLYHYGLVSSITPTELELRSGQVGGIGGGEFRLLRQNNGNLVLLLVSFKIRKSNHCNQIQKRLSRKRADMQNPCLNSRSFSDAFSL